MFGALLPPPPPSYHLLILHRGTCIGYVKIFFIFYQLIDQDGKEAAPHDTALMTLPLEFTLRSAPSPHPLHCPTVDNLHQHFRLLSYQNVVILLLINMVGQHCWVEYTTADQPTVTALPRITPHQHLRLLRDQNVVILSLIDMVGQHCWVEYTTADQPTAT